MFQRIARRHGDRSDEPVTSESADNPVETPLPLAAEEQQPATGEEQPATDATSTSTPTPTPTDDASSDGAPSDDAPTERIEVIAPPEQPAQPDVEQPTILQPAVSPSVEPQASASVPPPTIDLRSRILAPAVPAGAPQPAAVPAPATEPAPGESGASDPAPRRPGFRARGRMRRRLRYLRKLRELQVRDLGGLVFDLRRFERKRDDLLLHKLDQIRACDDELRSLERALDERRDLRDVREPGIGGTCPRCFAIFGSADRFCASCGAALGGAVQSPAQVPPASPPSSDSGARP
ncbi:MAG TPA: hypothetical protein VN635_09940 [Conexibacter sp.]|nr:hypothetical protein [Conexibacter sp.]